MGKLIANMTIRALLDGERVEFEPGEEVTGLPDHDVRELKASGALYDEAEEAAASRRIAADDRKARAAFDAERQAVIEKRESTATPPADEKTDADAAAK